MKKLIAVLFLSMSFVANVQAAPGQVNPSVIQHFLQVINTNPKIESSDLVTIQKALGNNTLVMVSNLLANKKELSEATCESTNSDSEKYGVMAPETCVVVFDLENAKAEGASKILVFTFGVTKDSTTIPGKIIRHAGKTMTVEYSAYL